MATDAAAAAASGKSNEAWTPVPRPRSQSFAEGSSSIDTSKLSKSARKNLRRKERLLVKKRWGVRHDDEDGANGGNASDDDDEGDDHEASHPISAFTSPHDDESIRLATEASLAASTSPTSPNRDVDDPRQKKLRNLRKKIAATEPLLTTADSLNEHQRAKLDRLPSLTAEASSLQHELTTEASARAAALAAQKAADLAAHERRVAEWTSLSDGSTVSGFRAGADADDFACSLCAAPFEAAVKCTPCGHVFCRGCLEDALEAAANRSGGDPKSLQCPLCRAALFDAISDRLVIEAAVAVKKKMRKKKCTCTCGTVVALSSLRAHLRDCAEAAPGLFGDDERKRFGHEFRRPKLDQDRIDEMAGRRRRRTGPVRTTRDAQRRGWVGEEYDEDAALQAALALSSIET